MNLKLNLFLKLMTDCIFCKIVNKEIPSDIFYEDDQVLGLMDIRPVSRGHCLVIPKEHYVDVTETPDALVQTVVLKTKQLAIAVEKAVGAHGFTLSTNRGLAAGQTIFHLHFHIIPRFDNDGLKPWVHIETEASTRGELAEAIRKNLA